MQEIKRGDIYLVNLGDSKGSIQGFTRPMIIVSNPMACKFSPVIHAVPTTGQTNKKWLPTHVDIPVSSGLLRPSIALCEQVQLITKESIAEKVGYCNDYIMDKVDQGLMVQFNLIKNKIIS